MQDMTDRFNLGKTINQKKRLCSNISRASSNCSLNEQDSETIVILDSTTKNLQLTKLKQQNSTSKTKIPVFLQITP